MSSAIFLLMLPAALAEDPTFQEAKDEEKVYEAVENELSVEIGGAVATGNAVYYTLNGLASGARHWKRNEMKLDMFANYGGAKSDADGDGTLSDEERAADLTVNTKRIGGELRYDRYVSDKSSLYVLGGGLSDTFAGYDLRTHEQLGFAHRILDTETAKLAVELGFDYAQENYVDGVDPNTANIFAARAQIEGSTVIKENVSLSEKAEVYENVLDPTDLRLLNTAAVAVKLSDTFSLKLSHSLTFDNVPVEGYQKLDQVGLVTLVASLM